MKSHKPTRVLMIKRLSLSHVVGEVRHVIADPEMDQCVILFFYSILDAVETKLKTLDSLYLVPSSTEKWITDKIHLMNQGSITVSGFPLHWQSHSMLKVFFSQFGTVHTIDSIQQESNRIKCTVEFCDIRDASNLQNHLKNATHLELSWPTVESVPFSAFDFNQRSRSILLPIGTEVIKRTPQFRMNQYDQGLSPVLPLFESWLTQPLYKHIYSNQNADWQSVTTLSDKSDIHIVQEQTIEQMCATVDLLVKEQEPKTKPKKDTTVDLEAVANGTDKRTTFMIKNLPNKYSQSMLLDFLNETHFGKFDFCYLRMDFKNKCNLGYAFVNFPNPKDILPLAERVVGKKWPNFNSFKVGEIGYATLQGIDALIERFRNSSVMLEQPSFRPKLFWISGPHAGQEKHFPGPNAEISRPSGRVLFASKK